MALQLFDMITGLLKQVLIAAQFGASATMDGYLVATTIVGLILLWVSLPIRQVVIPMFRYDLAQQGEKVAWANFSILLNDLVLVFIFIAIAGGLLSPYLVALVAPGFELQTRALSTSLTQISIAGLVFVGTGRALSQILYSYERFFLPGIVGTAENAVVILALLALTSTYGIYGLAAAAVLGAISRFVLQFPILWQNRQLYVLKASLRHPGLVEMGKLSVPLLISTGGIEIGRVADRIFASLLPAGSLSALSYATRLMNLSNDFFMRPLQRSTFPHFMKLSAEQNFSALSSQLFRYLRMVSFLAAPIAVGIMVIAEPVVRAVYQRGAFDETAVRLTSQALLFYAIGFPASMISGILDRTFFSLKDTWTPAKIALLRIGIKLFLAWILIQYLGHVGIALAESTSQIIGAFFLFLLLPDEVKGHEGWSTAKSVGRALAASALMGAIVYAIGKKIDGLLAMPVELAALILLGAVLYGLIAFASRAEELPFLLKAVGALPVARIWASHASRTKHGLKKSEKNKTS